MKPENRFINRELSWLEFNQRVLDQANDKSVPLLERLKFLAISAANLDEFFMVRVGSLQHLLEGAPQALDATGRIPEQQLLAIGQRVYKMVAEQYKTYRLLETLLANAGIRRLLPSELNATQITWLEGVFEQEIFNVLTPASVGEGRQFPLIPGLVFCVLAQLETKDGARFVTFQFAHSLPRFITLPSKGGYEFVLIEDVLGMFIQKYFADERVLETVCFRVTRNAELEIQEESNDLLSQMSEALVDRRFNECVRLELGTPCSAACDQFLRTELRIDARQVYPITGPLDLADYMGLTSLPGDASWRDEPWTSRWSAQLDPTHRIVETIAKQDVLLIHPYESFDPVVRFVEEAADDPEVLAIKQTLYRTGSQSAIIAALRKASKAGKQVTVIVELKARFDEARNIEWASDLERAGVQVIYGVRGYKTHAKLCIVVRREAHGIQRYVHFGTGNYNENTAKVYSDISLFTADEDLGGDAVRFFNAISGCSQPLRHRKLDAAPIELRDRLLDLIRGETDRVKQDKRNAFIWAKLNALVDPEIINALYDASAAGVKIRLNVRGVCCLRPGVKGLSDNIEVTSIVDRYLEHARILVFGHGGDNLVFISSADWMPRNLDRRLELLVPVEDPACKRRLIDLMKLYLADQYKGRKLLPDGTYQRPANAAKLKRTRSQEAIHRLIQRDRPADQAAAHMVFKPHLAAGARRS